jgi:hypothetical protein
MVEFVVGVIIATAIVVLVEKRDDIDDRLRIFLLVLLGDAIVLERLLPLIG